MLLNNNARAVFFLVGVLLIGIATIGSLCKGLDEGFGPTPTPSHQPKRR